MNEILDQAKNNFIDWIQLPEDVDQELMSILRRMLATNPSDRYQNTSELARDLEYYIYKDGYGPTIVTLANYMRTQLPALFETEQLEPIGDIGKTVVIPNDINEEKTVRLPHDYFKP